MSLRLKLLAPLLLCGLATAAYLQLVRLPAALSEVERQVRADLLGRFDSFARALGPSLREGRLDEARHALDILLADNPSWHALVLEGPDGAVLYPRAAHPHPEAAGYVHRHPVVHDGARLGTLVVYLPEEPLVASLRERYQSLVTGLLAALGVTLAAIALLLDPLVVRPVQALLRAVDRTAAHDFSAPLPAATGDEIGRLTKRFGAMREELARREAELLDELDRHARTSEALGRAKRAAEEASEVKSRFLAHMSHEIRTPLNGLLGMTELLLATRLEERQRHLAQTAHRSGTKLLDIVSDILDLSRIESGKLELAAESLCVRALLEDVRVLFAEVALSKGLALEIEVDPALPQRLLLGDPVRLRQVLVNLVGNAVKFTERGQVRVACGARPAEDGGVVLDFTVSDTGIGLAPQLRDRVFQSFEQGDPASTRRYGGTGLGLAICKQIIGLMGGEIGVEDVPGGGARFWFNVRLAYAARPAAETPASEPAEDAPPPLAPGTRVLIAEDNPVNAWVTAGMLEALGCRTETATDGRAAVEAVLGGGFDAVLMDCEMPELDGFDACREIRAHQAGTVPETPRIPIIAVTAHAVDGFRERCLAAGLDDYVTKPFTQAQIAAALARWLPPAAPRRAGGAAS